MKTSPAEFSAALLELAATLDGALEQNDPASPLQLHLYNHLLLSTNPVLQPAVPRAVVQAASSADAVRCVAFATHHGVKLHVLGSGHHYGGMCVPDNGLLLDMSGMQAVTVDPVMRTATAQPGVSTLQLREACLAHGLHFPGGHNSPVGIGGFILGGGNGWGIRNYGAASDNVLAFEVVRHAISAASQPADDAAAAAPADPCSLFTVDAESDADLFWGLRGGGAFLSVVTQFTLRLHPVPAMLPSLVACFPLDAAVPVGVFLREYLQTACPLVEATMLLVRAPDAPHAPSVMLCCLAFGERDADIERDFEQVRQLLPSRRTALFEATPPYLEALRAGDPGFMFPDVCIYAHGAHLPSASVDDALMATLERHFATAESHRSMLLMCPGWPLQVGGAVGALAAAAAASSGAPSASPASGETAGSAQDGSSGSSGSSSGSGATALGFRGGMYLATYALWQRTAGGPEADGDVKHAAWTNSLRAQLAPRSAGMYLNEVMDWSQGVARHGFEPAAYERLQRLKARSDPHHILRHL